MGARLLYGEPVGPIPSELSHGRGSVASHVYIDGYVSRCVPRFRRTSVALSRHQGASAQDVLLKDSNRAQAAWERDASIFTQNEHVLVQSRDWRNFRGVTPIFRRKFTVRWLWLENPTATAISDMVFSFRSSRSRARFMRRSMT